MLEDNGFSTDVVGTGQAALDTLAKHHYDLVLLDVGLPDLNGYEVAKQIRDKENKYNGNRTPIMIVSAHIDETQWRNFEYLFEDYITKRITQDKIDKIKSYFPGKPLSQKNNYSEYDLIDWNKAMRINLDLNTVKENIEVFQKNCITYISRLNSLHPDSSEFQSTLYQIKSDAEYCGALSILRKSDKIEDLWSVSDFSNLANLIKELLYDLKLIQEINI